MNEDHYDRDITSEENNTPDDIITAGIAVYIYNTMKSKLSNSDFHFQ